MTATYFQLEAKRTHEKLVNAVKRLYNKEERNDILEHGMSAGFSGLIYYNETTRFYARHKSAIWDLLSDQAEELGEKNAFSLLANGNGADQAGSIEQAENYMVWYAVEVICRELNPDW
jgi:hypothetical protein